MCLIALNILYNESLDLYSPKQIKASVGCKKSNYVDNNNNNNNNKTLALRYVQHHHLLYPTILQVYDKAHGRKM